LAKKAFVYDGTNWIDIAQSTADLSNYANMTTTPISGFRNAIINGDFRINQRGFTSNTTNAAYTFDRWAQYNSGGTVTTSAQTFTVGSPAVSGFESANYIRQVVSGQSTSGQYGSLLQPIEDVRTYAGATVTISFYARAGSGTPKIAVELQQFFGSGGSPSSTVITYANQVTLSTSWARYSITTTVPSISGKNIGTTANTSSLGINLWTSAGSDFNARSGSLGIQNNTFDIWGVQVERGTIATPFEQRPVGTELALCQRYYLRETAGVYAGFGTPMFCPFTTAAVSMHKFMIEMRAAPVFSIVSGSPAIDNYGVATGITYSSQGNSTQGGQIGWSGSGLTQGRPTTLIGNGNILVMAWSAEL
jgi:hypothetical protein